MPPHPTGNALLDRLAADELDRLLPHCEEVSLAQHQVLNRPGEAIDHVYFVLTGIVSLVASLDEGAMVEVGIIGSEGMVGTPVLLDSPTASIEAFVQIAGTALKIPTDVLLAQVERS